MKTVTITLELDKYDADAVLRAIRIRQGFCGGSGEDTLPEGGGNLDGRTVADICRGWEEMLALAKAEDFPAREDSGVA